MASAAMSARLATTLGSRTSAAPYQPSHDPTTRELATWPAHRRGRLGLMVSFALDLEVPLDLRLTLRPLWRGPLDPTMRLWPNSAVRASRTRDGPATLAIRVTDRRLTAEAWGPGAEAAIAALPALLGLDDDPVAFRPAQPLLRELARRLTGLRIGRTGAVMEALVPAILEQKVTGAEAFHGFRGLVRTFGERAPGPHDLWLQPTAAVLASLPYYRLHPLGIERRRADTIRFAASRAARVEEIVAMAPDDARRRLQALPGVGPWTAAEVTLRALGDPDAVSVGDYHIPNLVSWALAGEPRGDDARMLELLEPYRGHRARVIRLLESSGMAAPRYGPRMEARSIATI
jgi:3-methyladenine DNA glycosylase/8-oxoguanine DNA glycosylase